MNKKYIVRLSDSERAQLKEITSKGKQAAYRVKHAHILLAADEAGELAWTDKQISQAYHVHEKTVFGLRVRLVEQGFDVALNRKKQSVPSVQPLFDGVSEAKLLHLACSSPPKGRSRWTLRLLAEKLVELKIFEHVSYECVRKVLKKRTKTPFKQVLVHSTGTRR